MRSIIKVRNTTHKGGHKMRDWLLKLRIKNKMTQEEVAVKAEISRTTYASIEQEEEGRLWKVLCESHQS